MRKINGGKVNQRQTLKDWKIPMRGGCVSTNRFRQISDGFWSFVEYSESLERYPEIVEGVILPSTGSK